MTLLANNSTILIANISSLTDQILSETLTNQSDINNIWSEYINSILTNATYKYNQALLESASISFHNITATNLLAQLTALNLAIQQLSNEVNNIHKSLLIAQSTAANISLAVNEIYSITSTSGILINETESILANVSGRLALNSLDIQFLQNLLTESTLSGPFSGSGSGSDTMAQLMSSSIPDQLALLNSNFNQLSHTFQLKTPYYNSALSHSINIVNEGQAICKYINQYHCACIMFL